MARRERSAAVGGGVADKWGNRYEAWWTVWRGVLPVLRGEFDAIQIEPPDLVGEGAEFRLYGRQPGFPDEVHQCKRRHATSWTVPALDREGVLVPFGEHLGSGAHGVFASGTSSVLLTMAEKARNLAFADWLASLNRKEDTAKSELVQVWNVPEHDVHDRLTRLTVHGIEEATLRVTVVEYLAAQLTGDPKEALLRLADFVIDNLMVRLTSRQLWDFLRSAGFSLREGQDLALSERVRALNDRYVAGVERARPTNLPILARPEVDQIVQAVTTPGGPRVVAVTGPPGSGKSTALALVCMRLAELGVVVGPLRLDAADEAWTAEDLGTQAGIGFGGSPARVLARAAGGESAVLVIDQLDALSVLAGRGETVLDSVQDMLAQAQATGNLRLLIACRTHDLAHDRRLRQLVAKRGQSSSDDEPPDVLEVVVGDLDAQQVRDALGALGILLADMSPRLQSLLAKAFNLSLVANIVQDVPGVPAEKFDLASVRTRLDLLAAYDRRLGRRLLPTLGANGYVKAVSHIARLLSDSGRLSLPRSAVTDIPDAIDALLHEGVLAADENQLRFFHDEYFDFIFARQHIQAGGTAGDLMRGDAQDLLRRGQVRAVLTLERQEHLSSYALDLRVVLDRQVARSHLRAAVLTWLTDQATIADHELQLVLQIAGNDKDSLRWQAVRTLCSQPFVQAINDHGLLVAASMVLNGVQARDRAELAALISQLGQQSCAHLLSEAARYLPEATAAALLRLASDPDTATRLVGVLLRAVFLAGPTAGPITTKLFCTVVENVAGHALHAQALHASGRRSGALHAGSKSPDIEAAISALYSEHGIGILALSTLARRASAPSADAIRTWLTAAARLAAARGAVQVFDTRSPLPRRKTGLDLFEASATQRPTDFAQALTAFLVEQLQSAADQKTRWRPAGQSENPDKGLRYDHILGYGSFGDGLVDEIFGALRTALRLSAAQDPGRAAPVISQLTATDLLTAQQVAAAAFSACATPLLPAALVWASQPQVRGLGIAVTPAWAWGEVLAQAAHTGNDEQRKAALNLVVDPYRSINVDSIAQGAAGAPAVSDENHSKADQARSLAIEQLVALSLIARRLGTITPNVVQERLTRLEQILGPAPTSPTSAPFRYSPPSPIPDNEARTYADSDWVAAVHRYADEPGDRPGAWPEGGLHEVAAQLEVAAKAAPSRFARLAAEIGPEANPAYIKALVRAVTAVAQEVAEDDVADLLGMVRTISSWSQPQFNQPLCSLVAALADRTLPDDVIDMIATLATTATDPISNHAQAGDNLVVAGLTCDRGLAVNTLAHLLAPPGTRHDRVQRLLPTLEAVVQDPAEPVRVMCPSVVFRTCLSDIRAGVNLAEQWLARATADCLRAPELDRLTWQLLLSRPVLGAEMIQRTIRSAIPEVRTRGGLLAALTGLRQIELPDDGAPSAVSVLNQALADAAARKGVAILLAELVDELPEPSQYDVAPPGSQRADRGLLVRLLNDPNSEVRESAIRFALDMTTPLSANATLLLATATSHAYADHPATVLHSLRRAGGELPVEASLALCERWLSQHSASAGDIRTAAAGDAYRVVDIVLATHARTAVRSPERERCLILLDRLIESGAAEADRKADDPTSYWED